MPRRVASALLALAVMTVAVGCGGDRDKAGGSRTTRLTLQAPDGASPLTAVFVREAEQRAHGTLAIVVDGERYSSANPANEARLAGALRSGRADLALIPSRAWETQGVTTFRALQAPFLVTDFGLLRRIVGGPIGREILDGTNGIGVVGLTLLPDSLRRMLGRRPFTSLASLRGARIRIVNSATTAAGVRALGAIPVTGYLADQVGPALAAGRVDGTESSAGSILDNNYQAVARHLPANVVLFPKTNTIAIRRGTFEGLAPAQRDALREAAAATLATALESSSPDVADLQRLCLAGVRLARATPADLRAMRRAEDGVYALLRRNAATARILRKIDRLKADAPAPTTRSKCEARRNAPTDASGPTIPEGRYATTLTPHDFRGFAGKIPDHAQVWTTTLRNGRFRQVLTPTEKAQPPGYGTYATRGDEITFHFESPGQLPGVRETVRWSYYRGELSFKIVSVADSAGLILYTAHPWRKTGSATG